MFWKPTMPSLPIVNKRNALDVDLYPAHPKKIRKDDQSLQVTENGKKTLKNRLLAGRTTKLKQSH